MKRIITMFTGLLLAVTVQSNAQVRYQDEVFTNAQIYDTTNVAFGVNFNPYIDSAILQGTQMQPLMADFYMPDAASDTVKNRPVVIFLHSGSFLPQSVTGFCTGNKSDSLAVSMCKKFARHGFVAISADYRVGWLANSTDLDLRRGTNLLAVYYSIQDAKALVRYLNLTNIGGNPYGISTDNIILLGQGSGGYTTFGYASIDNLNELVLPTKFQYADSTGILGQPVLPGDPYVDTTLFGDWDGYGGAATITGVNGLGLPTIDYSQPGRNYINHPGVSDDVLMVANMGGALGDSSWIDAGEVPMVSIHPRYDFFAPYYEGMVQVPIGAAFFPVVYVQGSHWAVTRANALGNNDIFLNAGYTDALWTKGINNSHNTGMAPGVYTLNIEPLSQSTPWVVNSAPWDYWGTDGSTACTDAPNPNDHSQSKAYRDTVFDYILPRILTALKDNGLPIGIEEDVNLSSSIQLFPNPASDQFKLGSNEINSASKVDIMNLNGQVLQSEERVSFDRAIDISSLPNGVYFVVIHTDNGSAIKKLMVE